MTTERMNTYRKGAKALDFESKSLTELGNTAFLIQRNQNQFSQSIAEANHKIEQAEKELEVKERVIQSERAVIQKLQACVTNQNKTRESLLSELDALQRRLAQVEQDLAAKNKEISDVQQQVKSMEADSTNLKELVKKDKTNLPQLVSAQEDLAFILDKVQAVIEAKSAAQQTLSSDQLIVEHQLFMDMLMGKPSQEEPSSESPMVITSITQANSIFSSFSSAANNCNATKLVPSILHANSSSSSSSSSAETSGDSGVNLLIGMKGSRASEEQAKPRKRHAASSVKNKSEDARSHHDPQETRAALENLAAQIRIIFEDIHKEAKKTVRMEKVKCIRKEDGQWCVPDKERAAFSIIGCQGRRTPEQGFNVRIRNQVISQKLLDTGLSEEQDEYVEAVFEDPRDATAAYHMVSKLLD